MPVITPRPAVTTPTPTTPTTAAPTATTTTTTATTPALTTTATTTGLDAATTTGPAPGGGVVGSGIASGVNAIAARLGTPMTGPALLELRPGIVPDAVSLPTILKGMAGSPQADALITSLVAEMKSALGVDVPPALVAAARANPDRVVDMLALSPKAMRGGFDAVHAHHTATAATTASTAAPAPANSKSHQLPQHFKTSTIATVDVKRSPGDLKQLAPGLSRGDVPNVAVSDAAVKKNVVLAEIIDRLADNPGKSKADRFVVEHQGSRFTSLPNFIEALRKDGYTVEAKITHRVADFFALKTQAPDGSILDVPMAVMVKTGFKDAAGNEAIVPSVHSEVVFSIRAGASSADPKLDGDVKWYQGVPNTGFFPCDSMRKSTWTGSMTATTLDDSRASQALGLCAVLGDVIQDVAIQKKMAMSGYGITGVCNDSVAVIQQALTGTITGYPLFMRDGLLLPEIETRLKDSNRHDDAALKTLKAAIAAAPSDDAPNASSAARALASMPWAAGQAPFASTEAARAILEKASTVSV